MPEDHIAPSQRDRAAALVAGVRRELAALEMSWSASRDRIAAALAELREDKLYLVMGYGSFADLCEREFNFSPDTATRILKGAGLFEPLRAPGIGERPHTSADNLSRKLRLNPRPLDAIEPAIASAIREVRDALGEVRDLLTELGDNVARERFALVAADVTAALADGSPRELRRVLAALAAA